MHKQYLIKQMLFIFMLMIATCGYAAGQHRVVLEVMPGCGYCAEAKKTLDEHGVTYKTIQSRGGRVPKLYVDGKYIGTGSDAVESWVQRNY